jgi:hypothetical protein
MRWCAMDDREREYRLNIEEARRRAERAVSESERRSWLTIAESWARLLGFQPQPQPQQQPQQKLQDDN